MLSQGRHGNFVTARIFSGALRAANVFKGLQEHLIYFVVSLPRRDYWYHITVMYEFGAVNFSVVDKKKEILRIIQVLVQRLQIASSQRLAEQSSE